MSENDIMKKIREKIEEVEEVESVNVRDHSQGLYVDYHVSVKTKEAKDERDTLSGMPRTHGYLDTIP